MAEEAPISIEDRISALNAPEEAPQEAAPQDAAPEAPQEIAEAAPQEPEASQEETPEPEAAESAPDVEEIEVADIAALAEHIGTDVADLYNVPIPYTKDGERHEFTLGEIKDQLPEFRETLAQREQVQAALKQQQELQAQMQQRFEADRQQVATHLQAAEQALLSDMASINWEQLKQDNPGEWAAKSEEFRRKHGELQRIAQEAASGFSERQKAIAEQTQKQTEEMLQREQQQLLRAIPEWRDDTTAEAERSALVEYMRETGYTSDELNNVVDHRALVIARKAMLYDKYQKNGDVAKKKVVKLAKKIVKPGSRQTAREAQQDREQSLVKAHRANPKSVDAAAARISTRLGG